MKKNFIYTVIFLLCGSVFFSSCEDMLQVDSDRVEYEFDDWTLNDSVYSVLGILKSVQEVGDRQVILNELRADLISISETKAVVDIQEISKSVFNLETNKYLDVKDYYAIINNCNIYLARVDTTLEKNNVKLMIPEYVAVKSVRAWTYLQLAINHNNIPYFTEPILSHSAAEAVMNTPMLTREEVITKLIADIEPYENPAAFTMPAWDVDGKVLKFGYGSNGTEVDTKKLFMPIRMLLGDMYLWRAGAGDYKKAAHYYYSILTGYGTNATAPKYGDAAYTTRYSAEGGEGFFNNYANLFAVSNYSTNSNSILCLIPYAKSDLEGTISDLATIFLPQGEVGAAQVAASPGILSLSERQVYRYYEGDDVERPDMFEYSHDYEFPGDLRIPSVTCTQMGGEENKTEYKNLIAKFNLEKNVLGRNSPYVPQIRTSYIMTARPEQAYLRFAEALMGLEREGYEGAMDLAMTVLKVGVKRNYPLIQNPVYAERAVVDANGDTVKIQRVDPETGDTLYIPRMEKYLASYTDSLGFNFTDQAFTNNKGIHSRGSGDSERNEYYALNDICVARYFGKTKMENNVEVVDSLNPVTRDDYMLYVQELILDEMALELAWEGYRFGDLVRVAKAINDPDVLAKRIAGRAFKNAVSHRHPDFEMDNELYSKMVDEANWYLPLPAGVVEPGKVEPTPDDFNPGEPEVNE